MKGSISAEIPSPSQPDTLQALEDLARAINYTQENLVRISDSVVSVIGHYDTAPRIQNSFDILQTSTGITNAISNLASQVRNLNEQANQQADILSHQFGSFNYFQPNDVNVKKSATSAVKGY